MAVEAIRLLNFSAFRDTGWLALKPITLLFGYNSRGKSAFLRALLLLKQSRGLREDREPFVLFARGGADLGSFREMVYEHDLGNQIQFGFRCNLRGDAILNELGRYVSQPAKPQAENERVDLGHLELVLGFRWSDRQQKVVPSRFEIQVLLGEPEEDADIATIFGLWYDDESYSGGDSIEPEAVWVMRSDLFSSHVEPWPAMNLEPSRNAFWPEIPNEENVMLAHPDISTWNFIRRIRDILIAEIEAFLESIEYVGPLRPVPARIFSFDPLTTRDWRDQGWSAFIRFLQERVDQQELVEILQALAELEVIEEKPKSGALQPTTKLFIEGKRDSKHADAFIARVEVRETKGEWVSFKDIGFGASQVLPVIAESVIAGNDKLVIIEQPEVHLHPSAQAALADIFIKQANRGKRFLIETHSEHLLLRFRRRIGETARDQVLCDLESSKYPSNNGYDLRTEQLELAFVNREEGTSTVNPIRIDSRGQLVNPLTQFRDFFRYDYEDLSRLSDMVSDLKYVEEQE